MSYHDMKDDEMLRRYLLGQMDEEQEDQIEQRLLKEDALFELAEAMEGDLLDAAARRALPPTERGHVLWHLAASPGGRARLALVRGLATIDAEPSRVAARVFRIVSHPGLRAAAVAASLVLAAGGAWLATRFAVPGMDSGAHMIARGLPAEPAPEAPQPARPETGPVDRVAEAPPAPVTPEPETVQPETAPAEERVAEQREPRDRPEMRDLFFQLALTSVRSSGGAVPRLTIPPGSGQVEFRLPLAEGETANEFSAVLRNVVTGEEVRSERSVAARTLDDGKAVIFSVPSGELPEDTYEIEVRGEGDELLGRPVFEVHRP